MLRHPAWRLASGTFALGAIIGGVFLNAAGFFSLDPWPADLLAAWGSIIGGIGATVAAGIALLIASRQRASAVADRLEDLRERRKTAHRRAVALALALDMDLGAAYIVAKRIRGTLAETWTDEAKLKICTRLLNDLELASLERAVLYVDDFDLQTATALTRGLAVMRYFHRVPKAEPDVPPQEAKTRLHQMKRRSRTARMAIVRMRRTLLPYVCRDFKRATNGKWSGSDYWQTHVRE